MSPLSSCSLFKKIALTLSAFLRYRKQYTPFYFGIFGKGKTDAHQQKHKADWRPSV